MYEAWQQDGVLLASERKDAGFALPRSGTWKASFVLHELSHVFHCQGHTPSSEHQLEGDCCPLRCVSILRQLLFYVEAYLRSPCMSALSYIMLGTSWGSCCFSLSAPCISTTPCSGCEPTRCVSLLSSCRDASRTASSPPTSPRPGSGAAVSATSNVIPPRHQKPAGAPATKKKQQQKKKKGSKGGW